jgi:hypothetical protein
MRKYNPLNIYTIAMNAFLWLVIILAVTQCACGMTLQSVNTESYAYTLPPKVGISAEPTDAAKIWRVTEPLTVRSCASVDCTELAYVETGAAVQPMTTAIDGAGCAGGGWVAIVEPAGFVCNLYLEEK